LNVSNSHILSDSPFKNKGGRSWGGDEELNVSNSHILSDRLAAPTLMWDGRGVEVMAWEGEEGGGGTGPDNNSKGIGNVNTLESGEPG
jgi:hypothetical protein